MESFIRKAWLTNPTLFLKRCESIIQIEFGYVNSEEFNQFINIHVLHKPIKFMLRSNVLLQNRPNQHLIVKAVFHEFFLSLTR